MFRSQLCFYEIFTRLESQTGQTAEVLAAMFVDVTPARGAQPSATGCRTPPEWPLAGVFHAALQIESWFRKARRRTASTRLGQRSLRHLRRAARALQGAQQPHGPDDLATIENAHELGDRQFGVAIGGHEIVGELGLGGAHRVQNCREFILHNTLALYARCPGRIERAGALSVSRARRACRRSRAVRSKDFALVTLLAGTQGPPRDLMIGRSASLFSRLLPGEIENAAGYRGGTVMWQKIGYFRQKAAECAARAQEAADKDTRALFLRFRDSWLSAANRYESSPAPAPDQTPQWRPSPLTPEPSTHDWRWSPNDARTDTTAERLGAA